jgi:hypothetical protein
MSSINLWNVQTIYSKNKQKMHRDRRDMGMKWGLTLFTPGFRCHQYCVVVTGQDLQAQQKPH